MDRRKFIVAGLGGAAAGCARPRSPWRFLSVTEARTLEAVCAHIIPADKDPGAVEAGVAVFIDRQLSGFYKPLQETYRQGIAAIDRLSVSCGGHAFADLPARLQLEVLQRIERDPQLKPFFDLLVAHSMQGFYGDPRHGGNRERVGWKMLGVASPPVRGRA
ncbi:MAG TPA: gluconate 2-dehydrogenase subunit 3 family protein [Bryobacteraceae bacterium]|nr:gluconate 2-dehydrogenase subunit 3 family protein [Bryobacteraceae bacterium]